MVNSFLGVKNVKIDAAVVMITVNKFPHSDVHSVTLTYNIILFIDKMPYLRLQVSINFCYARMKP